MSTSIDCINNSFIFLSKSINEIFIINGISKKSKFVDLIFDELHILRDSLGALDINFQLVLDLFDVVTG